MAVKPRLFQQLLVNYNTCEKVKNTNEKIEKTWNRVSSSSL